MEMNSKEALNDIIEELKWGFNDGKTLTKYDEKRILPILRDINIVQIIIPFFKTKKDYEFLIEAAKEYVNGRN